MPMAYTADKKPYEVLTFWLPRYNDMDPAWKRELIDFVGMTVIGCARGITLVAPICYAAPLMSAYIVTAFTLSGFGYWLGYRIPFKLPKVTMGAEWGEGLTGFFVFTVLGYFAWLRFVS